MFVDLLLDLDDDLMSALTHRATTEGDSVEEIVRRAIMTSAGEPYAPLTDEQMALMRPIVSMNLCR